MIVAFFFLSTVLLTCCVIAWQHFRFKNQDPVAAATIFETSVEPPFLRPVITRLENDELKIDAPVVHARLVSDILVLEIKSNSGSKAEGFELAITDFDPAWLTTKNYGYHPATSNLLVGPQGEPTDRILNRTAHQHQLDLPMTAGIHVQAFDITGVVTDPAEFRIEIQARLPNGAPLHLSYDYAHASVHGVIPAEALNTADNYQPLTVQFAAAA